MSLGTNLAADLEVAFTDTGIVNVISVIPAVIANGKYYVLGISLNSTFNIFMSYTATVPLDTVEDVCNHFKTELDNDVDIEPLLTTTIQGVGALAELKLQPKDSSTTFAITAGSNIIAYSRTPQVEKIATAIADYLKDGVYAAGAFTFESSLNYSYISLTNGFTAAQAAAKWAAGLENYFVTGTATPVAPNTLPSVIYPAVKATLTASLTTIFSDINQTAATQASAIASAYASAVATISAQYTNAVPTLVVVPAPAIT